MQTYPAQHGFTTHLTNEGLSPTTISSYSQSITHLINFLEANRPQALADQLNSVTTNDLRAYLSTLQEKRQLTLNSYNKTLSQLNRYFTYLFENQLIDSYPTLPLHGKAAPVKPSTSHGEWINKLPRIIDDPNISFYTRLVLLLIIHGYTISEFLQPGFYRVWEKEPPTVPGEQHFRQSFAAFHHQLSLRQQCDDLFLKQRVNLKNPRLSNSAVHKYLKADAKSLGMKLAPSQLHQEYVLTTLKTMKGEPNTRVMQKLRLSPSSLLYYQRLLIKQQSTDQH